jgi:RNA polymerase sigma-70 factor (ECF subfamily)
MIDDDSEIIENILSGDPSKYELIIKKYQVRIISLCYRYTKNHHDAEEVAQESFLRAYKSLDKFRYDSKFYSWLHRISVNCSLNYINSKQKLQEKETISDNIGLNEREDNTTQETPYNTYNMEDIADKISKLYENLPDDLKLMIKYRDIDDMTYDEIASISKLPIGTVRSRLHRAREILLREIAANTKDE